MSSAYVVGARSSAAELMDDDATDYATFRDCLADLSRVNALTLAYRPTLGFLEGLRRAGRLPKDRPVAIVDVGSGYGDTLREIAGWAKSKGVKVRLTGVDRNPWSARAAREVPCGLPIRWRSEDVFDYAEPADIVLSSLFTHHLDDRLLARFVRWSEQTAAIGWFVNDLRRARFPYVGFGLASRLLGMHRFVTHDGPVSIARSFVEDDWSRVLDAAGVPGGAARVERWFPYRLCVSRVKG